VKLELRDVNAGIMVCHPCYLYVEAKKASLGKTDIKSWYPERSRVEK
jgi:hypothetical protein